MAQNHLEQIKTMHSSARGKASYLTIWKPATRIWTPSSHTLHILSLCWLCSSIVFVVRGCAPKTNSGNAQNCATPLWRNKHVTYLQLQLWKATKLCHVTATFCNTSVQRKVCDVPASHFKDTYAAWQKLLQAPSHVLDQHFIFSFFLFLLPHGANKWRKIVSILHTLKASDFKR